MKLKRIDIVARCTVERNEEWREWIKEIPYIRFPSEWEIKIIPPFGGAMARFLVKIGIKEISVYLDCHGSLGACDTPYWEVYPYNDDVYRCDMNETAELINAIRHALEQE